MAITKASSQGKLLRLVHKKGVLYIFYDFECCQTKDLIKNDPSKKEHEVNLCVTQQACDKCRNSNNVGKESEFCGKREHVFWGENIVDNFMQYLGEINRYITLPPPHYLGWAANGCNRL